MASVRGILNIQSLNELTRTRTYEIFCSVLCSHSVVHDFLLLLFNTSTLFSS